MASPPYSTRKGVYDGIVLAVSHQEFMVKCSEIRKLGQDDQVLYDLKYVLPADQSDLRL